MQALVAHWHYNKVGAGRVGERLCQTAQGAPTNPAASGQQQGAGREWGGAALRLETDGRRNWKERTKESQGKGRKE